MTFTPTRSTLSRNLREMQLRTGGIPGEIKAGGGKISALRLAPNIFVTDEKVSPSAKTEANLSQADIHRVEGYADFHHFLARYRAFRRTNG
jgi:hypothetical protein